MSNEPHVTVVGAGLAGLAAAVHLHDAGVAVTVVDAADEPGGRIRTDVVDGFLLDRGFQVLNTAYPEARRLLDLDALALGAFEPGALTWVDGRFHRVGDPLRRPRTLWPTLRAPIGGVGDKLRVLRLRHALRDRTTVLPADAVGDDEPLDQHLRHLGFSTDMIERFLRPLFAGITLDPELTGSSRVFEFVFAMLSAGSAAVPARGMGAIPRQLAERLPAGSLRLDTPVAALEGTAVRLESGELLDADAVVVATDADAAHRLTGGDDQPGPATWRGVTTWWFAAERAPLTEALLMIDGSGQGPVVNAAVMTSAAPTYAPAGRALVQASAPSADREHAPTDAARRQLATWFPDADGWDLLRTDRIARALPATSAPLRPRSPRLGDRRYLAGDHVDNPSIDGALASGRRAAGCALADLGRLPATEHV